MSMPATKKNQRKDAERLVPLVLIVPVFEVSDLCSIFLKDDACSPVGSAPFSLLRVSPD
jgi:hypothetical protein